MQLADIQGGRTSGTSSANPVELRRYAQDGLELVTVLRAKATDVVRSIQALARQGYPRSLGDADVRFQDLVADWYHLDEFAGDVADGFFRASGPGHALDGLVRMDDAQLLQLGRFGYADRDQAINEAHRLAGELDRLRRGERVNVRDLFDAIRRARHDPAFAVTFSERIGVRGYVEAAAMLRGIYRQPGGDVSPQGVEALRALSGTITTALDTLPTTLEAERHDPDNAGLLDSQRLSGDFVHDLVSGYQPDPSATQRFGSPPNEADLAALVGFTDPPTAVAVAIANSRMRRRLTMHYDDADTDAAHPNGWGRNGGLISAYAGMLSRNDDAAAHFLGGDGAIEGALRRHEAYYADGGAAIGALVEAGVTHENPVLREPLMHRAITEVGGRGRVPGPHTVDALTAGYGWNRELISRFESGDDFRNTANMLAELMKDGDARDQIRRDTQSFLEHRGQNLAAPGTVTRDHQLIQLGRLHQLTYEADLNVLVDQFNAEKDAAARQSALIDFTIGNLPGGDALEHTSDGLDIANNVFKQITGSSAGELAANPDSRLYRELLRESHALKYEAADRLPLLGDIYSDDTSHFLRGAGDVEGNLREFNVPDD